MRYRELRRMQTAASLHAGHVLSACPITGRGGAQADTGDGCARLRKCALIRAGGAGFVGSHLVDRLMLLGHDVVVLDNYVTGAKSAVAHWLGA